MKSERDFLKNERKMKYFIAKKIKNIFLCNNKEDAIVKIYFFNRLKNTCTSLKVTKDG